MKIANRLFIPIFLLLIIILLPFEANSSSFHTRVNPEVKYNRKISFYSEYEQNGNFSALLAIDSSLFGSNRFFPNFSYLINTFEYWVQPFETKFGVNLHFPTVQFFTPGVNDSLFETLDTLYTNLSWIPTYSLDDPHLDNNGYDILVAYQESYNGGRNHANALLGNALIIAHDQPLTWTTRQLILMHELCHLFGGEHDEDGEVDAEWYGNASRSILDYEDLTRMRLFGYDRANLPIDDHNYFSMAIKNQTEFGFPTNMFRFDLNDPDQDNIPNWYEYKFGLNATWNDGNEDNDEDLLTNWEEWNLGTRPEQNDTDFDGYLDSIEVDHGSSPFDPDSIPNIPSPTLEALNESLITQEIDKNFTLIWEGNSDYPQYYEITRNGSIIVYDDQWTDGEINLASSFSELGKYNFTCRLVDVFRREASSSIIVDIIEPKKTSFYNSSMFLALLIIAIFFKRKSK